MSTMEIKDFTRSCCHPGECSLIEDSQGSSDADCNLKVVGIGLSVKG